MKSSEMKCCSVPFQIKHQSVSFYMKQSQTKLNQTELKFENDVNEKK